MNDVGYAHIQVYYFVLFSKECVNEHELMTMARWIWTRVG